MRAAAQRIQEFTKLLTDYDSLKALEEMIEEYPDILKRGPTHPLVYDDIGVLKWKADPNVVATTDPDHTKWNGSYDAKCGIARSMGYSLEDYQQLYFVEAQLEQVREMKYDW